MAPVNSAASGTQRAATAATVSVRLDPRDLLLLGTFGSTSKPGALLRLPSGETRRVEPGDVVANATVVAISNGMIVIDTGGTVDTLHPPGSARAGRRQTDLGGTAR